MPTIYRLCHQMKETETEMAPEEWQLALLSYEAAQNIFIHAMSPDTDPSIEYPTNTRQNPTDLDEPILLKDKVKIPAFMSQIVHMRTQMMYMKGHCVNVMIQPPYQEDQAKLPAGLYIQRVYTELKDGSQNVSTVLQNGTGRLIHLTNGRLIGCVVVANLILDTVASPELEKKLANDGEPTMPLTTKQHQELLMEVLKENGSLGKLDGWF